MIPQTFLSRKGEFGVAPQDTEVGGIERELLPADHSTSNLRISVVDQVSE